MQTEGGITTRCSRRGPRPGHLAARPSLLISVLGRPREEADGGS